MSSTRAGDEYLQLASQMRARIESGEIRPREALPSITYLTGQPGWRSDRPQAIGVLVDESRVHGARTRHLCQPAQS